MIKEDIRAGYAPKEISFGGYVTKNLHHAPDAAKAFQDTIERVGAKYPKEVLSAIKATDTYMGLNDLHMEQGQIPDPKEINKWKDAHAVARDMLNRIGEFPHHEDVWHMHEHELQDIISAYNPNKGDEMADSYEPEGNLLDEELTDKTIKSNDKIKVARVIADMLGVEDVEKMSPDAAVNMGLRKVKNKKLTPEFIGVVKKMVNLANEVGIKVDMTLLPKQITEETVAPLLPNGYNSDILLFKDYIKLATLNQGKIPEEDKPAFKADEEDTPANIPTQVGHTMGKTDDQLRRRKIKYRTESVDINEDDLEEDIASADFKLNPITGRKYRAHRITFDTNKTEKEKQNESFDNKSLDKELDISEDDLNDIADDVDTEDDILDAYDDNELQIIDQDTGKEADEKNPVNEELLNEVLSRAERLRARIRFMRTASKRARRLKIVLKRHSDVKTINRRARHLAIKLLKEKILKKPIDKMSVAEKERVEKLLEKRKQLVNRLAMRLVPRIRKIEAERLSHTK